MSARPPKRPASSARSVNYATSPLLAAKTPPWRSRFIVAAVVTPPDVISQLALAIPMCILYEIGILAAQVFIKHTKAPEAEAGSDAA